MPLKLGGPVIMPHSVVGSIPKARYPSVEVFWFQNKISSNINTASGSTLALDHSCCQRSLIVVTPYMLSTVVD